MTCPSTLICLEASIVLVEHPCIRERGHEGRCVDSTGYHHWTRLGELLRQDGLEIHGVGVRRIVS